MERNDIFWRGLAATAALSGGLIAIGCQSTLTGNEGELEFSYTTDDLGSDFNKPVAVGAKLDMTVRTADERQNVDISDVIVDEDVFIVDSFAGNKFTIEAVEVGNSLVEVDADGPAGQVSDSVNMRTAVPEVLNLYHSCTGENRALYTAGKQNVVFPFDMKLESGTDVIGYGYYPVDVPPGLGTLQTNSTNQGSMRLDLGTMPGDYTLSSTIDDTTLSIGIIEESQITGVSPDAATEDIRVVEGESAVIIVWPEVSGDRVCQSQADIEVTSLTTATCTVRNSEAPEDLESYANPEGYVTIEGIAAGECRFEVSLPNGNGGAGATTELTAQIGTFPGEDG